MHAVRSSQTKLATGQLLDANRHIFSKWIGKAMPWKPVSFGKHRGKTLPQILFKDPDWFFWALEEDVFRGKHPEREITDIAQKAQNIAPKEGTPESMLVQYTIHPIVEKLADVDLVPHSRPAHEGSSPTQRKHCFDLSFGRELANYDKTGADIIIRAIKFHYFGDCGYRMTKARCEAFFDEPSNFFQ
jgi:hypothetical protein